MNFLFDQNFLHSQQIVDWGYTENLSAQSFSQYQRWLDLGYQGPLSYLAGERGEKRENLQQYFPECESALVFLFSYAQTKAYVQENSLPNGLKVGAYALGFAGEDYHYFLRRSLESIKEKIQQHYPQVEMKLTLDVHPVLERDLAYRAGLGWFGKNSMLINRSHGSYVILGSLLLSQKLSLPTKTVETDHCGTCRACLEACPTEALVEDERVLISEKCISTYTIELFKEAPAPKGYEKGQGYFFGCDICQEVCPWNKTPLEKYLSQEFKPSEKFSFLRQFFGREIKEVMNDLTQMTKRSFKKVFQGTVFERTGRDGILKNLKSLFL